MERLHGIPSTAGGGAYQYLPSSGHRRKPRRGGLAPHAQEPAILRAATAGCTIAIAAMSFMRPDLYQEVRVGRIPLRSQSCPRCGQVLAHARTNRHSGFPFQNSRTARSSPPVRS